MKYTFLLIIFFSLLLNGNAQDKTELIDEYLAALSSTMHGNSTSEDVDKLLMLYADDIVYEHPKFGMKIETKDSVKGGLMSFLESYGGTEDDARITSSNQMLGSNVSIVEFEMTFKTKEDQEVVRKQIQVLEINNGKISRIIDYW